MTAAVTTPEAHSLTPHPRRLSPRIQRLRNYYFQGADRRWNNRFLAWSTGTP